jgi:D-3-phosphoglycerate dehydrogenase
VAGVTARGRRNVASISADQIVGLLAGELPPRLVNPEVWAIVAEAKRLLQPMR